MDEGVDESVDFDFFDEAPPVSPNKDLGNRSPKASTSNSKPPVRPRSAKPAFTDNGVNGNNNRSDEKSKKRRSPSRSSSSRSSSPDYSSDYGSDSEDNKSKDRGRARASPNVSSRSGSSSSLSESDKSTSRSISKSHSKSSQRSKASRSRSSSGSDRPSNPIAKGERRALPKRGRSRQGEDEYSSSAYSDGDDSTTKKSSSLCPDDGDRQRGKYRGKQEAWGEANRGRERKGESQNKAYQRDRPKTAKTRSSQNSDRYRRARSRSKSDTLSDSDITDVSPMESPRNGALGKSRMTPAGDGGPVKVQYKAMPVTDLDLRGHEDDDHDPDRTTGLDLEILMKAVGELEKQKRLQANSRRVMFAPMTLKRGEKANYTFDENQTRDIERENQRLLKEIVRRVSNGEQKKQYHRGPSSGYKLTPSAVNREREIKRIESENLAFLKRLQKVKPTKAICRDNQLRDYETTTLHGVPIAALHPLPTKRTGRRSVMGDTASTISGRTRSMTSINSATSSVRSFGSRQSSRPSSATKRPGSATKRIDRRPEWSDRW